MATCAEMPRSPGHAFYDRLQDLLREAAFDAFVEGACKPYYAPRMGAPSLPPRRYFRMHMIGYFEGIDSERGIAWRCALVLAARFPAAVERREGSRSFVAVAHALASAARGARDGVRLGAEARGRARPGGASGSASTALRWRPTPRCARSCGATRRELSRDADADGERAHRHAERRGPGALRPERKARRCRRRLEQPADRDARIA